MINFTVKMLLKRVLHAVVNGHEDSSPLQVLSGPARGTRLDIDLRKEASYWLGKYDDWITERVPLPLFLKPGDTVWDCGAYIGYYTAIFRKLVGPTGFVYAFEASHKNFNRVSRLSDLNHWDNVKVLQLAIGPENSSINFAGDENGASGPVGLVEGNRSHITRGIEIVRSCGVDELIMVEKLIAPSFIKFDLETAEIYALKNGAALFSKKAPVLLLELHGNIAMKVALEFAREFDYLITDVFALPRASSGLELVRRRQEWVGVFKTKSDQFMSSPPVDAPHMTLAIPRQKLEGLCRGKP